MCYLKWRYYFVTYLDLFIVGIFLRSSSLFKMTSSSLFNFFFFLAQHDTSCLRPRSLLLQFFEDVKTRPRFCPRSNVKSTILVCWQLGEWSFTIGTSFLLFFGMLWWLWSLPFVIAISSSFFFNCTLKSFQ